MDFEATNADVIEFTNKLEYVESVKEVDWSAFLFVWFSMCASGAITIGLSLCVVIAASSAHVAGYVIAALLALSVISSITYIVSRLLEPEEGDSVGDKWHWRLTPVQIFYPPFCRPWVYPFNNAPLMLYGAMFALFAICPAVFCVATANGLQERYAALCVENSAGYFLTTDTGLAAAEQKLIRTHADALAAMCTKFGPQIATSDLGFLREILRQLGMSRWEFCGNFVWLGILYWVLAAQAVCVRHIVCLRDTFRLARLLKRERNVTHYDSNSAGLLLNDKLTSFDLDRLGPWKECFNSRDGDSLMEVMEAFLERYYLVGALNSAEEFHSYLRRRNLVAHDRSETFMEKVVLKTIIEYLNPFMMAVLIAVPFVSGLAHSFTIPLLRVLLDGEGFLPVGLEWSSLATLGFQLFAFSLFVYNLVDSAQQLCRFEGALRRFRDATHGRTRDLNGNRGDSSEQLRLIHVEDISVYEQRARPQWAHWRYWIRTRKYTHMLLTTPRIRIQSLFVCCLVVVLSLLVGVLAQGLSGEGFLQIGGAQSRQTLPNLDAVVDVDESKFSKMRDGSSILGDGQTPLTLAGEEDQAVDSIVGDGMGEKLPSLQDRVLARTQVEVESVSKFQIMCLVDVLIIAACFSFIMFKAGDINDLFDEHPTTIMAAKQQYIEASLGSTIIHDEATPPDTISRMDHYVQSTRDSNREFAIKLLHIPISRGLLLTKMFFVVCFLATQLKGAAPGLLSGVCSTELQLPVTGYALVVDEVSQRLNHVRGLPLIVLKQEFGKLRQATASINNVSNATLSGKENHAVGFTAEGLTPGERERVNDFFFSSVSAWANAASNDLSRAIEAVMLSHEDVLSLQFLALAEADETAVLVALLQLQATDGYHMLAEPEVESLIASLFSAVDNMTEASNSLVADDNSTRESASRSLHMALHASLSASRIMHLQSVRFWLTQLLLHSVSQRVAARNITRLDELSPFATVHTLLCEPFGGTKMPATDVWKQQNRSRKQTDSARNDDTVVADGAGETRESPRSLRTRRLRVDWGLKHIDGMGGVDPTIDMHVRRQVALIASNLQALSRQVLLIEDQFDVRDAVADYSHGVAAPKASQRASVTAADFLSHSASTASIPLPRGGQNSVMTSNAWLEV
eukprot:TRINITY_DN29373_c0_g1_i1.p1 TRINITY_DN29373_c0_g1~~TRINITY_DN29373_c0_g1_i1.p1  ORF type:complete len:1137 (-),score=162.83 TRINITY_DN29373_c0_g1_i1:418-3828(-)